MIDPVRHIPGYWSYVEELTAKALELGIWYEDDDGNLVKEPVPGGAFDETSENYILRLDAVEAVVVVPPARVVPKPKRSEIRSPTPVSALQFNSGWNPRKAVLPSDPEEDARLIAEALARGQVTKCPPGYARNIK